MSEKKEVLKGIAWPEKKKRVAGPGRAPKYDYASMEVDDGINTGKAVYEEVDKESGVATTRVPNALNGARAWAKRNGKDWKFEQHVIDGMVYIRRIL